MNLLSIDQQSDKKKSCCHPQFISKASLNNVPTLVGTCLTSKEEIQLPKENISGDKKAGETNRISRKVIEFESSSYNVRWRVRGLKKDFQPIFESVCSTVAIVVQSFVFPHQRDFEEWLRAWKKHRITKINRRRQHMSLAQLGWRRRYSTFHVCRQKDRNFLCVLFCKIRNSGKFLHVIWNLLSVLACVITNPKSGDVLFCEFFHSSILRHVTWPTCESFFGINLDAKSNA